MSRNWTPEEREILEGRVMRALARHVGRAREIGMAELFEQVFQRPAAHRINSTRALRNLIYDLQRQGERICSSRKSGGGGYWLAAADSELRDYLRGRKKEALKILSLVAVLERRSLPELLGQMAMEMRGTAGTEAGATEGGHG